MIEPYVNENLRNRLRDNCSEGFEWSCYGIHNNSYTLFENKSLNPQVLKLLSKVELNFIYLDGLHTYDNLLRELHVYWKMLKPGGVIAGHDYCSNQTNDAPVCGLYTEFKGTKHNKPSQDQSEVVKAVQNWSSRYPNMQIHITTENFTAESLDRLGFNYSLVITSTRNPSWYYIKPTHICGSGKIVGGHVIQNPKCIHELVGQCKTQGTLLSLIILYYEDKDRMANLLNHYRSLWTPELQRYVHVTIIDDGSPRNKFDCDLMHGFKACCATIKEDITWNIGGARNLAAYVSPTPHLLFTDSDSFLSKSILEFSVDRAKAEDKRIFIDFPRVRKLSGNEVLSSHPAVMLLTKHSFWSNGGCDEDFVGSYGFTDVHFKKRLDQSGYKVVQVKKMLHVDPIISQFEDGSIRRDASMNKVLYQLKTQLILPWSNDCLRFNWSLTS
ncbi:hypothetical protein M9434_002492 [Picochlorum sp. BPE23]|nr:hypothetical protein M9434_002492 [Picochlorum sp. BPE23]